MIGNRAFHNKPILCAKGAVLFLVLLCTRNNMAKCGIAYFNDNKNKSKN